LANSPDPDIRGVWPALLRAARRARKLAESTGTPLYLMRDGKVVDALVKPAADKRRPRKSKDVPR
jgi:hypothetical protein